MIIKKIASSSKGNCYIIKGLKENIIVEAGIRFDNIKKALYMETLGRPEGTPMSATEVAERMADLSRQIGSSFGRLQSEFVNPLLRRVIRLLIKQGKIEIPKVNGREVKIVATSPLSQAQHQQDVADVMRFSEILGQTFGPQMLNMVIKQDEVARYLADKMGYQRN